MRVHPRMEGSVRPDCVGRTIESHLRNPAGDRGMTAETASCLAVAPAGRSSTAPDHSTGTRPNATSGIRMGPAAAHDGRHALTTPHACAPSAPRRLMGPACIPGHFGAMTCFTRSIPVRQKIGGSRHRASRRQTRGRDEPRPRRGAAPWLGRRGLRCGGIAARPAKAW
jgi:hypothetical protein